MGLSLPESSRAVCGSAEAAWRVLTGLAPRLDALRCHVRRQPCRLCLPALSRAAAFISNRGDSQVTVTLGLCQQSQALQRRAPSQE